MQWFQPPVHIRRVAVRRTRLQHVPLATVEMIPTAYPENLCDFRRVVTYLDTARVTVTVAPADTPD